MKYDIFISYRRQGGYETAKHLYDLLVKDGYKVSFDIDTLRNGDFDYALLARIDQCKDFIVILNEGAFDRTCDVHFKSSQDWLRIELAYALKKQKNVIPVMLDGFHKFPENLPADIARIAKKNGPLYNHYYFDEFYKKLKADFLVTRKAGHWALKTMMILLVICLVTGGVWWYNKQNFGEDTREITGTVGSDSLSVGLANDPKPKEKKKAEKIEQKKTKQTPPILQSENKIQEKEIVKEIKLPEWMFLKTQKYIGIAPAGLSDLEAKEFTIAMAAYQWVIAQGKYISGRDTTIGGIFDLENCKLNTHYYTSEIPFEYKIERDMKLSGGERLCEISFFNSKRGSNTLQIWQTLYSYKNNSEQNIKIKYTGFDRMKTYEFKSVSEEGNQFVRSYLNDIELKHLKSITKYADGGKFLTVSQSHDNTLIRNIKIGDFNSLSEAWEQCIFSFVPLMPDISVGYYMKSVSDSNGGGVSVSEFNDGHIEPVKVDYSGIKNNILSVSFVKDIAKQNEFLKEDSIKKAVANDFKTIDNFGKE